MDAGSNATSPPTRIDPTVLVVVGGRLDGQIADFADDGTLDLRYRIELELAMGEIPVQLRLVGLELPARTWRVLAELSIEFGPDKIELHDGEPVRWAGLGDLSTGALRQPLAATRLDVVRVLENPPRAVVDVAAKLYPPGPASSTDPVRFHVTATVAIGSVDVLGPWTDIQAAVAAAEEFLDLADYDREVRDDMLRLTPR